MHSKYLKHLLATITCVLAVASCTSDGNSSMSKNPTEPDANGNAPSNNRTVRISEEDGHPTMHVSKETDAKDALSSEIGAVHGASMADLRARLTAALSNDPLPLVLIDRPLADGAIAEVHLNKPGELTRFMVIPRATLQDETIDRASDLARQYEMKNSADRSYVRFILFANGDFTVTSSTGVSHGHQQFEGVYSRKDRKSYWLGKSAALVQPTDIPGVGLGRIMSLGERPKRQS